MTTPAKNSLLVIAFGLAACHRSSPDLTAELEKVRAAEHLPALAIGVWKHGEQVALAATGLRKSDDPAHPVTVNDRWHLGSDTKAMTAMLVGMYVDRGKLHWDDTLAKIFAGETIDPALANVTIDQLLEHRGGLAHDVPFGAERKLVALGNSAEARTLYVQSVLATPPKDIGTYSYSNAGYVLLGAAVERAAGKRWEEVIREELFGPLGMTECGFGAPGSADALDQPWGHLIGPVTPSPEADNVAAMGPAGTVHCSLPSWGKFLATQASGKTSLLTPATFAHLHTPPAQGKPYMGGWGITPLPSGELAYRHDGSNGKWYAIAIVVPGRDLAIAITTNQMDEHLFAAMQPVTDAYVR